jgi:CheY-like chemotaxis protein
MEEPLNILLVEDDELDVLNVQRALRRRPTGAVLTVARDGVEALDLLRHAGLATRRRLVIILDLRMPRMNGLEFLRALRTDTQLASIPVIVLTTSADDGDRREAWRHHIAGYLLKPVSFASFQQCMDALCTYWDQVEFPVAS